MVHNASLSSAVTTIHQSNFEVQRPAHKGYEISGPRDLRLDDYISHSSLNRGVSLTIYDDLLKPMYDMQNSASWRPRTYRSVLFHCILFRLHLVL
jgi:hypothetical protein